MDIVSMPRARKRNTGIAPGKSIAEVQSDLLAALRAMGSGPHTRGALADHLGKARLNVKEQVILEMLVDQGIVEKGSEPSSNPHILTYTYRVK